MWERLEAVWLTYWTRPFLLFFSGLTLLMSIGFLCMIGSHPLFHQNTPNGGAIGVFLSAMAMLVGWSGMAIFGQVILQFQCPFARLLPGYARPHLIVAGALLLAVWCAACALTLSARPPWPLAIAIPSTFLGATFAISTSAFPGDRGGLLRRSLVLLGCLPAVLLIAALLSHQRGMPAGAATVQSWHAGLSLLQLAVLTVLIVRYLPESSRFFAEGGRHALPMGAAGFDLSLEQVLKENAGQPARGFSLISPLRESDLTAYHDRRWFRRLRLWQAGGSPGPLRTFFFGLILQIMFFAIMVGTNGRNTSKAGFIVMQTCMTLSIIVLQTARGRQLRFGVEWLRPISRQAAVGDFVCGLAWDLLAIPLVPVAAAVWISRIEGVSWTGQHWICLLAAAAGAYVLSVGLVSIFSLVRSNLSLLPAGGLMFLPSMPCTWVFLPPPRDLSQSSFLMMAAIVGLSLVVPGVVLIAIARRKWLNRELG